MGSDWIAGSRHDDRNRCRHILTASAAGVPLVMIKSTSRRTNSVVKSGKRSARPSAERYSMTKFCPST